MKPVCSGQPVTGPMTAGSSAQTVERRRHERSRGRSGYTRDSKGGFAVIVLLGIIKVRTILILQRNSDLIGLNWKIVFNQI